MASDIDLLGPIVRDIQRRALDEPDAFWSEAAARIPWFREWDEVFEWTPEEIPAFRWFLGGETNLAYACLDAQVANGNGGRAALICLDENGGQRVYTYAQLLRNVERMAASLRGDRHRARRPGRDLHADQLPGDRADAGLCADRGGPPGDLRRLRRRSDRRAGQAGRGQGDLLHRLHLSARPQRAARSLRSRRA